MQPNTSTTTTIVLLTTINQSPFKDLSVSLQVYKYKPMAPLPILIIHILSLDRPSLSSPTKRGMHTTASGPCYRIEETLHHHHLTTVPSLCRHCTSTVPPLYRHCTAMVSSLESLQPTLNPSGLCYRNGASASEKSVCPRRNPSSLCVITNTANKHYSNQDKMI